MKRLTPVTTRATKMGRGAIWYPFTDYNFPETIQSKSTFSKSRSEAGRPRSSKKMRMEVRKARPMAEGPTTLTTVFPRRLPKNPLITKPIAGNRGINQTYSSIYNSFSPHPLPPPQGGRVGERVHSAFALPFQQIDLIPIDCFSLTINHHKD